VLDSKFSSSPTPQLANVGVTSNQWLYITVVSRLLSEIGEVSLMFPRGWQLA